MKFYIRIVLLAAFLTSLLSAHAQSPTITWDSTVKNLGDSNYEVVFTGKILPGWHTYDLHSDVSSTLVEFEPATGLTLDGDPYEINASKREYDDIFEVEMGTYFDEIILGQKVTLTGEGAVLKGNINWRSCEEENCNSPEDWGFEITIGDPEAARASVAAGDAADQPVSGDGAGESKTLWGHVLTCTSIDSYSVACVDEQRNSDLSTSFNCCRLCSICSCIALDTRLCLCYFKINKVWRLYAESRWACWRCSHA